MTHPYCVLSKGVHINTSYFDTLGHTFCIWLDLIIFMGLHFCLESHLGLNFQMSEGVWAPKLNFLVQREIEKDRMRAYFYIHLQFLWPACFHPAYSQLLHIDILDLSPPPQIQPIPNATLKKIPQVYNVLL